MEWQGKSDLNSKLTLKKKKIRQDAKLDERRQGEQVDRTIVYSF